MTFSNPFRLGAALAITVALGYAACTILFWSFPEAAAGFMMALFHGLDFELLRSAGMFTFGSFVGALAVLAAWAFLVGTLFGWLSERLGAAD